MKGFFTDKTVSNIHNVEQFSKILNEVTDKTIKDLHLPIEPFPTYLLSKIKK